MKRAIPKLPPLPSDYWPRGCTNCKYGIVAAPELTGAVSLYLERMVQMIDGDVTFCTCQAGTRYRSALLNRRQALIEEAKRHQDMTEAARKGTHPEIEGARRAMLESFGMTRVPTVHYDAPTPEAVTEGMVKA